MGHAPYTPLPSGKYYYQQLKKDYELWPTYNSSSNPHDLIPGLICLYICPCWYYSYMQSFYASLLKNNPVDEYTEDTIYYPEETAPSLPLIPGLPSSYAGMLGPHGMTYHPYVTR